MIEKREIFESSLDLARVDPDLTPLARHAFALLQSDTVFTDEEIATRIGCGLKAWFNNLDALKNLGYLAPGAHDGQAALWPVAAPLLRLNMLQSHTDAKKLLEYLTNPALATEGLSSPDKGMSFLLNTAQLYQVGILGVMSAARFITAVMDTQSNDHLRICLFGKDFDKFRGLLHGDLREQVGMRPTVGVAISDKRIYIYHDHPNASACQQGAYTLHIGDRSDLGQIKVKTIACTLGPHYKTALCTICLADGYECATIELPSLEPLASVIRHAGVPVEVEDTAWK